MQSLENEVRNDVARLLAILQPQVTEESADFQFVLNRLTSMAIVGKAPAGCGASSKRNSKAEDNNLDDYSESKMNWIEGRR